MIRVVKNLVAVTTVFNRSECVDRLVRSLSAQTAAPQEIVIVDHGTVAYRPVRTTCDTKLTVLRRSSSLWFTGAVNEGLRYALKREHGYKKFLVMNDDIVLSDDGLIKALLAQINEHEMLSVMAVDDSDVVQYSGLKFSKLRFRHEVLGRGELLRDIPRTVCECDVLPTRLLLTSRTVIEQVGLLNEAKLPHYASDYEWTGRAKRRGVRLVMSTEKFIRTGSGERLQGASGRRLYDDNAATEFFRDLFDPYKCENIHAQYQYSVLSFTPHYAMAFFAYKIGKKVLGMVYTNYGQPAFSAFTDGVAGTLAKVGRILR